MSVQKKKKFQQEKDVPQKEEVYEAQKLVLQIDKDLYYLMQHLQRALQQPYFFNNYQRKSPFTERLKDLYEKSLSLMEEMKESVPKASVKEKVSEWFQKVEEPVENFWNRDIKEPIRHLFHEDVEKPVQEVWEKAKTPVASIWESLQPPETLPAASSWRMVGKTEVPVWTGLFMAVSCFYWMRLLSRVFKYRQQTSIQSGDGSFELFEQQPIEKVSRKESGEQMQPKEVSQPSLPMKLKFANQQVMNFLTFLPMTLLFCLLLELMRPFTLFGFQFGAFSWNLVFWSVFGSVWYLNERVLQMTTPHQPWFGLMGFLLGTLLPAVMIGIMTGKMLIQSGYLGAVLNWYYQ